MGANANAPPAQKITSDDVYNVLEESEHALMGVSDVLAELEADVENKTVYRHLRELLKQGQVHRAPVGKTHAYYIPDRVDLHSFTFDVFPYWWARYLDFLTALVVGIPTSAIVAERRRNDGMGDTGLLIGILFRSVLYAGAATVVAVLLFDLNAMLAFIIMLGASLLVEGLRLLLVRAVVVRWYL